LWIYENLPTIDAVGDGKDYHMRGDPWLEQRFRDD